MFEVVKYMESCSCIGEDEIIMLKMKYDEDTILSSLKQIVSMELENNNCSVDEDMFYQVQLDLWERYGYCFSYFHYYPFYDVILNRFENVTKNRGLEDDSRISLEDEVKYGFQLLAKKYITIMDDSLHVDLNDIFKKVSFQTKEKIILLFSDFYKKCPVKSYYDDGVREFLSLEEDKLNDDGDCFNKIDDEMMIHQIKLYLDYRTAKFMLTSRNLKLINKVVSSFQENYRFTWDDFYQEGYLGLLRTCDKFDIRYGYKFSTYAIVWIHQAISRFCLQDFRMIKIGLTRNYYYQKLKKYSEKYELLNCRKPTVSELSLLCGIDEDKVSSMLAESNRFWCDSLQRNVSLDGDGDVFTLEDVLESDESNFDEDVLMKNVYDNLVDAMDGILSSLEKDILFMHIEQQLPFSVIAEKYHCSRQRIDQVEKRALMKLRRNTKVRNLNPY